MARVAPEKRIILPPAIHPHNRMLREGTSMQTKTCTKCKQELPVTSYSKDNTRTDGLSPYCKPCRSDENKAWRERNAERKRQMDREYRASNLEKCRQKEREYNESHREERNAYFRRYYAESEERRQQAKDSAKEWRKNNPEKVRQRWQSRSYLTRLDHHLRGKFGITLADYNEMLEQQEGLCAICRQPPRGQRRLVVDHCHETGKVRQLLCHPCNSGMGLLQDNPELLAKAIQYLERHT